MRRRDEVLVGIFTLISIAALLAGIVWLARGGLSNGYPVYAKFSWGAGLKQGQPVLFSGVNVGYVDDVHLLENGGLVVVMRVYKKQRIPEGTTASIAANGIFGDQLIALKVVGGPTGRFLAPGDTMKSGPPEIQLSDIIGRVDTITTSLNHLLNAFTKELVDEKAIRSVRIAAQSADSLFKGIAKMVDAQSKELTKTQETLRHVTTAIDSAKINGTIDDLRKTSARANAFIDSLTATNGEVHKILAKINNGDGSLGQLLNSKDLVDQAKAALKNMTELLADFKANPRKYIKLSIF